MTLPGFQRRVGSTALFLLITIAAFSATASAQNTVTGAFLGRVTDRSNNETVPGATVTIIEESTSRQWVLTTDTRGEFYRGLLAPGIYRIRIALQGFQTEEILMPLKVTESGEVVPVPVSLMPLPPGAVPGPVVPTQSDNNIRVEINTSDARRDESFTEERIAALPLGSVTITRTLDELATLAPGVAPPPQTIGDVAGPGVGPGVGSAGQFAVNGLRSRANNFTVDGSDNNDEDIGVRRQGFLALTSQPVESVKEFQIITLLAPAQFGRNIGAQVNLVSKAGTSDMRGSLYGFFNSYQLNARNFFDTDEVQESVDVASSTGRRVFLDNSPYTVRNDAGGEDKFTAFQGGGVLGGPIVPQKLFYFLSAEYQKINATREKSFAVPTVEQRGAFGTGATGIDRDFFNPTTALRAYAAGFEGAAIFSLFPFPNNPTGIFDRNTFTQVLPAGGRGVILSGRLDNSFAWAGREQSLTGRYNFTDDDRDIPSVNEAIFATVQARTQTHNLSLFLNSRINNSDSDSRIFNQIRGSFGRSRLRFEELRDTSFLIPSSRAPNDPFLLNARAIFNETLPPLAGPVTYKTFIDGGGTVEGNLGPIGQVVVGGFSPLGVDVYNFPQTRVNNTYQLADELSWAVDRHNVVVGFDIRRTSLDSDLPRLSRPLATFNGGPRLQRRTGACQFGEVSISGRSFCYLATNDRNRVVRPEDLVALGAASSFLLTFNVARPDAKANLRYDQLNFYGQDTWRIRRNLSLSYGLRYEYNTPVKEADRLIEDTFDDPLLNSAPGLRRFIDGRDRIFDPDKNNFAPRLGFAYSPEWFGNQATVIRAGYGIFYDQILGAVVNQSRNVFPTFATFNLGGIRVDALNPELSGYELFFFNPATQFSNNIPLSANNTVNTLDPRHDLAALLNRFAFFFPNAITATLPTRRLDMPMAHHYSMVFEQQLSRNYTASIGYVGTTGENLLRFTTPNLGPGSIVVATQLSESIPDEVTPPNLLIARGLLKDPNRREPTIGAVNQFETTASSRYNSLQTELRGRFATGFNFLVSYVYSKVEDDVSDVFDLAGASALPQDSLNLDAERGPANFDVRHRFTYDAIYNFGDSDSDGAVGWLTDNLRIGTTGRFHTGQPFTVNSIVDVNFDGNLTDRLNTIQGLEITGSGREPLRLIDPSNPYALLAPFGSSGAVGRNTFRAGKVLELDLSVAKGFSMGSQKLFFRTDIFNFINRANFGIPVRFLEAAGFGRATSTITPARRIQFSLKYEF